MYLQEKRVLSGFLAFGICFFLFLQTSCQASPQEWGPNTSINDTAGAWQIGHRFNETLGAMGLQAATFSGEIVSKGNNVFTPSIGFSNDIAELYIEVYPATGLAKYITLYGFGTEYTYGWVYALCMAAFTDLSQSKQQEAKNIAMQIKSVLERSDYERHFYPYYMDIPSLQKRLILKVWTSKNRRGEKIYKIEMNARTL